MTHAARMEALNEIDAAAMYPARACIYLSGIHLYPSRAPLMGMYLRIYPPKAAARGIYPVSFGIYHTRHGRSVRFGIYPQSGPDTSRRAGSCLSWLCPAVPRMMH